MVLGDARDTHLRDNDSFLSSTKPSAMSGLSRMGRSLFGRGSLTSGTEPETPPLRFSELPVAASRMAAPSARKSFWAGFMHRVGVSFGFREQINAQAWESVRACDEMRSAVTGV